MEKNTNNKEVKKLLTANLISAMGSGISNIGVSWLLANKENGVKIFGMTILVITVVLFIITPYIGVVVDRYSRKKIFLLINLIAGVIILINVLIGLLVGHFTTSLLIILFSTSNLYYALYFPILMAFSQEIFDRSLFKQLNSMLEVQNQAAAIATGGLAGIVLGMFSYAYIFLFDVFTFFVSFGIIFTINYQHSLSSNNIKDGNLSALLKNAIEGFNYLKKKPMLIIFFMCSLTPILAIMASNYLTPIFISHTLNLKANVFGASEMTYAIGAVASGFILHFCFVRLNYFYSIIVTMILFTVAILLIALFPSAYVLIVAYMFLGFGNVGTRIARNTLIMELIPNVIIGRVNSFFENIGLLVRIIIIGTFTFSISSVGSIMAWWILGILMIIATIGVLLSRKVITQLPQSETSK